MSPIGPGWVGVGEFPAKPSGGGTGITSWGQESTSHFHGSGSPVGVVVPSHAGDLYVDYSTPALWQANGLTATDWVQVGGAGHYASLTGSGETSSPGELTQNGPLTVAGNLTVRTATEIVLGSTTVARILVTVATHTIFVQAATIIALELTNGTRLSLAGGGVTVTGNAHVTGSFTITTTSPTGGISGTTEGTVEFTARTPTTPSKGAAITIDRVGVIELATDTFAFGLFVYNGDPNGHVTSRAPGALCVDTLTPALWQSTATGTTDWEKIGAGTPLDVTVNSDAVTSSGLLPLQVTKQPLVPPSGIVQPLPPLYGFQFPGTHTTIVPPSGTVDGLFALAVARNGDVYASNIGNNKVIRFSPTGTVLATYTLTTTAFTFTGMCVGSDQGLWLVNSHGFYLHRLNPTTGAATRFLLTDQPFSLCAGPDGRLWLLVFHTGAFNALRVTPATPAVRTLVTTPLASRGGICAGPDGNVWMTGGKTVCRITPSGTVTTFSFPTLPANANQSMCAGSDGNLWFTGGNSETAYVARLTPAGALSVFKFATATPTASSGAFPYWLVSGGGGDLWVTDTSGNQLWKVTVEGNFTKFAAGVPITYIVVGPDGAFWCASNDTNVIVHFPFLVQTGGLVLTSLPTADPHNKGELWNTTTGGISTLRASAG